MNIENVRTIIWDCDNVMWFHKKEQPQILATALQIAEVEDFTEQFFDFLNEFLIYFKNKKVNMKETLKLLEKDMPILGVYSLSPEYFMKVFSRLKVQLNDFNYDTLVVMEYLASKGIKNIIKSDWWRDTQEKILQYYGVMKYIEELHCCDNAYLKNNPLSVKELIKQGREEQYLIIGDSLTSDIMFAKNAGIKSIWLNSNSQKNNTEYKPDFEVASLLEVMQII